MVHVFERVGVEYDRERHEGAGGVVTPAYGHPGRGGQPVG